MDGGALWAIVHGVAESQTGLSDRTATALCCSQVPSVFTQGFRALCATHDADEEPKAVSIPLLPFANKKRSVSNTLT